jgi:serpin B
VKESLISLGMGSAFSLGGADFSAMTEEKNEIYIRDVLHKCYVRVDELGAEAAAVTAVEPGDGAMMMEFEPPKFYADRPFLFAIYSLEDGAVAFLGAVNNPLSK